MLVTIWPLFALICLGFVLARSGFPGEAFWPAAERVNYFLMFPALLFSNLATAPVRDPELVRLGGAALATILVAAALLALWRAAVRIPAARFGPALQGVIRFNTYLGAALVTRLAGPEGLAAAAVYLAVAVPLVNLLSILALSGGGAGGRRLFGAVARNPLILACLAGLAAAFAGTGLPHGTGAFLGLLAQASLPLGLLCVGAALRPGSLRGDLPALAAIGGLRLLAMPLLAAGMARALGLEPVAALVLVVFSAVPTAPTAYVLTRQLGGDGALMAGLITGQTLAAVLSLPLVLLLVGS